jgi:heptose I phosphotransferase
LVGWGSWQGKSFVIFDDLTGFTTADKLVERGTPFATLLQPTADLAAALHKAGLHHRDLYLCHFMARVTGDRVELRLIDTARVKRLPGLLTRRRWIIKDLAQFWYSTLKLAVSDGQRSQWLARYAQQTESDAGSLVRGIERKSRSIARHDARLHRMRPERDVSIPG